VPAKKFAPTVPQFETSKDYPCETNISRPEVALKQIILEADDSDDPASLSALPCNRYQRFPSTEADIRALLNLSAPERIAAFAEPNADYDGYRVSEALVFFIRRALTESDNRTVSALFAHLIKRCQLYFRRSIRGFDEDTRQAIQDDVLQTLITTILKPDDSADYLECRFWHYMKRRVITALAAAVKRRERAESLLDDCREDEDGPSGSTVLSIADHSLSPEQLVLIEDGLSVLPPELRELYILRFKEEWPVGDERVQSNPDDPTLADRYGITPRAIRKRLAKAEAILTRYRSQAND
jgi:hypothetical protein